MFVFVSALAIVKLIPTISHRKLTCLWLCLILIYDLPTYVYVPKWKIFSYSFRLWEIVWNLHSTTCSLWFFFLCLESTIEFFLHMIVYVYMHVCVCVCECKHCFGIKHLTISTLHLTFSKENDEWKSKFCLFVFNLKFAVFKPRKRTKKSNTSFLLCREMHQK